MHILCGGAGQGCGIFRCLQHTSTECLTPYHASFSTSKALYMAPDASSAGKAHMQPKAVTESAELNQNLQGRVQNKFSPRML